MSDNSSAGAPGSTDAERAAWLAEEAARWGFCFTFDVRPDGVMASGEVLGWLNPETGKTCSAAEKLSMEQHQGLPGVRTAKGFRVPLVRGADGVDLPDGAKNG